MRDSSPRASQPRLGRRPATARVGVEVLGARPRGPGVRSADAPGGDRRPDLVPRRGTASPPGISRRRSLRPTTTDRTGTTSTAAPADRATRSSGFPTSRAASLRPAGARRDRVSAAVADPPLRGVGRGGRLPRPRPRRLAARGCARRSSRDLQRLPPDHRVRPGPAERDDRRRPPRRPRAARRSGQDGPHPLLFAFASLVLGFVFVNPAHSSSCSPGSPSACCSPGRLTAARARARGAVPRRGGAARAPLQSLVDRSRRP